MDELTPDRIRRDLETDIVGRAIEHYPQVASTNDIARERARTGHPEGLLVLADEQIAGRGRMGRGWAAPPGSSLLMSLLLRPDWLPPANAFALTMLASVALCEAVEATVPTQAALKWPNDLLLPTRAPGGPGLRKAAGILSELDLAGDQIGWVVIGIGVNVNWAPQGVVDGRDLAESATSVGAAAGGPADRLALLRALLARLDSGYTALRRGEHDALFHRWRARLAMLGQSVAVRLPTGELHGIAAGVEPSGALLVRDTDGVLHTVLAGDIGF
jgi:BirA family transcriptional regulator, biotin operon repressor / biotin---[acetyl-CoA-carboxylase] ligase